MSDLVVLRDEGREGVVVKRSFAPERARTGMCGPGHRAMDGQSR